MSISQACAMDVDYNCTCGSLDESVVLNDAEIDVNDSLNINYDSTNPKQMECNSQKHITQAEHATTADT